MLTRPGTEPNKPSPSPFPAAGTQSSYDVKVNLYCEYYFHIPLALSHARIMPLLREINVSSEMMAGIVRRSQQEDCNLQKKYFLFGTYFFHKLEDILKVKQKMEGGVKTK